MRSGVSRRSSDLLRGTITRRLTNSRALFSTSSTGFVQEQHPSSAAASDVSSSPKGILISAAEEAKRLSDLAAKNRPAAPTKSQTELTLPATTSSSSSLSSFPSSAEVTEETLQNALNAAQALLIVTFRSSPPMQQKQSADKGIQEQISCLHRAFLAVTSWCLDVAEVSRDPRILDKALEVAKRAHQLQLPFILPLHQRLMNVVAQLYTPPSNSRSSVASTVLEISSRASHTFGTNAVKSSHFFQDSLLAMVQRRRWRDTLLLLQGMEYQHEIGQLDLNTLSQMLTLLEDFVQDDTCCDLFSPDGDWQDEADFVEILSLLNPYVWKSMSKFGALSDMLENQRMRPGETMVAQESDANHEQEEEEKDEVTPSLVIRKDNAIHKITTPDDAAKLQASHQKETEQDEEEQEVLPVSPSYSKTSATSRRRRNYREREDWQYYRSLIYGRIPFSALEDDERYPDITGQLARLAEEVKEVEDEEEIRYSDDYEKYLLKKILSEDDEDTIGEYMLDDFDDDDGDGGHPYFGVDDDEYSSDDDDGDDH